MGKCCILSIAAYCAGFPRHGKRSALREKTADETVGIPREMGMEE